MKPYVCFLLLAGAVACANAQSAIQSPHKSATAGHKSEQNKTIVTKFMNAELKGDTAAMSALMTDNYIQYGLGINDNADKARTLNGVQHHWEVYKYGGKRYTPIETIAATTSKDGGRGRGKGDWVLVWGDMATDYPATPEIGNKPITATFAYHAAYRVTKGKVDTRTVYFNHEDISRQLGYKMVSAAAQKKP